MLNTKTLRTYLSQLTSLTLITICLVLGIVGIVLPIIPGVLFLVIGAFLAAKMSTRIDNWLRRSPTAYAYIDMADSFSSLSNLDRIKLLGWASLQSCIDIVQVSYRLLSKWSGYFRRKISAF